jgi:hypothetical protein
MKNLRKIGEVQAQGKLRARRDSWIGTQSREGVPKPQSIRGQDREVRELPGG